MFLRILLLTIVSLSVHAGELDDGKPYNDVNDVNDVNDCRIQAEQGLYPVNALWAN